MRAWTVEGFKRDVALGRPVYWMHEISGRMKRIVTKFLENKPLTREELGVIRWYVYQWVHYMPSKPDDYKGVMLMDQSELKSYTFHVLVCTYGIDPF